MFEAAVWRDYQPGRSTGLNIPVVYTLECEPVQALDGRIPSYLSGP